MHTAVEARGRGVGRAVVRHLLAVARENGCERVSLETGSMEAFLPARELYESFGFSYCPPFGDYAPDPNSVFLTRVLSA
jgi:putative acetyltransferase